MKTLPTNMPGGHYDFPWERRTMAKDPKPYSIEAMMDSITEGVNNEALDPEDVEQVVEAQKKLKRRSPKKLLRLNQLISLKKRANTIRLWMGYLTLLIL